MHKSQKGFALIESLLIILILVIVAFAGYYVWHTQQNTDKVNSDTLKAGQSAQVPTASSKNAEKKSLSIKEWGVSADYESPVDLVYKIKTDDLGEAWAQMSSAQLVNSDPQNCSIDSQLGGIIVRLHSGGHIYGPAGDDTGVTVESAINTGSLSEYSHVGDYYYYYEHPQAACGTDGSKSSNLQNLTLDAVKAAAKSFKAT